MEGMFVMIYCMARIFVNIWISYKITAIKITIQGAENRPKTLNKSRERN